MSKRVLVPAVLGLLLLAPAPAAAQSYAVQVWDQLQEHWKTISKNSEDWFLENYVMGRLNTKTTDSWTFILSKERSYVITGACDNDCQNVDLVIKDDAGTVIDSDAKDDDTPVVALKPAKSGAFTVDVLMVACKEEPCYFGIGVFAK